MIEQDAREWGNCQKKEPLCGKYLGGQCWVPGCLDHHSQSFQGWWFCKLRPLEDRSPEIRSIWSAPQHYPTLIFNVERPDEQVILRPVSMHRVMFNCTSKFRINGFMRKKSVVMENSFCFNPKIWEMSKNLSVFQFVSMLDWIAGRKL